MKRGRMDRTGAFAADTYLFKHPLSEACLRLLRPSFIYGVSRLRLVCCAHQSLRSFRSCHAEGISTAPFERA